MPEILIKERKIGENQPVFIIGEPACGHEGSIENFKQLILAVTKADAVKLHMHHLESYMTPQHEAYELVKKICYNESQWKELFSFAKEKCKHVIAMPNDRVSLKIAIENKVDALYIHPAFITDYELVEEIGKSGLPIFIEIGGCFQKEIKGALERIPHNQVILMFGFQAYPTPEEEHNLKYLSQLKKEYNLSIGICDHIDGESETKYVVPLMATALGASVIEKHVTLSRSTKPTDYISALEPAEFSKFVDLVRKAEVALGSKIRQYTPKEINYRNLVRKNLVATRDIQRGELIQRDSITAKRSPPGIDPSLKDYYIGKKVIRIIKKDENLQASDIEPRVMVALIARLKSQRLPKKALKLIKDKPLIVHMIDRLKKSHPEELVLCTSTNSEDDRLIEVAKQEKIPYFRGSEEDVLSRIKEAAEVFNCQAIITTFGDNPLTDPEYIDKMIKEIKETDADYISALDLPIGTFAYSLRVPALKRVIELKKESDTEIWGPYFTDTGLFKIKKLEVNPEHKRKFRLTVDEARDFEVVEKIYNELYKEGEIFSLSEVISYLDSHPEVTGLNQEVIQRAAPQIDKEKFEDERTRNSSTPR